MKEHLSSPNMKKKLITYHHCLLLWGDHVGLSYLQNLSCSCNSHTCTFQYTSNTHSFYIYIYLLCSWFCNCTVSSVIVSGAGGNFVITTLNTWKSSFHIQPYSSGRVRQWWLEQMCWHPLKSSEVCTKYFFT